MHVWALGLSCETPAASERKGLLQSFCSADSTNNSWDMNCNCYLHNVRDFLSDEKTLHGRGLENLPVGESVSDIIKKTS